MKRLLVAIAAVGLLASAFAFFASSASAAQQEVRFHVVDQDSDDGDLSVQGVITPLNNCDPNDDQGQVDSPAGLTFNFQESDSEDLQLDDTCNYTVSFSAGQCVLWGDEVAGNGGDFQGGEAATVTIGDEATFDVQFNEDFYVTVTEDCAGSADHEIYKNVPIADADVFAMTTFTFLVTPAADTSGAPGLQPAPASCTSASVDITGDGSPAVVVEATVAASVLVGNEVLPCSYDITEVPVDGWTNQIPLFGNTQPDQTPGVITPFRNVFDPVSINVTKSMDLDDFVVLSNIDTALLNERIDFFISASDGCADSIIDVFNGQLGSTGTFVNTSPAQVELAGFNDNVFTGEDVPVVVDGEACTYVVEELADADLLEYCAPVNGDTQSLTWAPGLTSLDFTFHNDCEAPAEPEPTTTPTDGSPTPTPDVDDGGAGGPGGPSFAG